MQLTRLIVLASAALGAVAQYDNGNYEGVDVDVGMEDIPYENTEPAPVAIAYKGSHEHSPAERVYPRHRCQLLRPPVAGDIHSIKVLSNYCILYLDNFCQRRAAGYRRGRHEVRGVATQSHTIKCF
ncbi:cell wall protein [Metarhizium album ARSEF 1941]|uniref:Cell wall protein n=1 Tax=Metarhizium album (strain ARSEF 1941) TaxID=1081103 RepID=A0A0B2WZY1_METAS|nr:cell wall protein [Metarhizium album ARSEF 1941]KHN98390.1 cell wall protein [Metarhizium album ARSEF 1941]